MDGCKTKKKEKKTATEREEKKEGTGLRRSSIRKITTARKDSRPTARKKNWKVKFIGAKEGESFKLGKKPEKWREKERRSREWRKNWCIHFRCPSSLNGKSFPLKVCSILFHFCWSGILLFFLYLFNDGVVVLPCPWFWCSQSVHNDFIRSLLDVYGCSRMFDKAKN